MADTRVTLAGAYVETVESATPETWVSLVAAYVETSADPLPPTVSARGAQPALQPTVHFVDRDFDEPLQMQAFKAKAEWLSWAAQGGPEGAELTVTGPTLGLWQLGRMLRYGVECRNQLGDPIWWGYVAGVKISVGGIAFGLSLDKMSNSVAIAYATADGSTGTTAFLADDESVLAYGTKQLLITADGLTTTAAEQRRANALNRRKLPISTPPYQSGGKGDGVSVTLDCRGWYDTLDWQYYSRAEGRLEYLGSSEYEQAIGLGSAGTGFGFRAATRHVSSLAARFFNLRKGHTFRISGSASNDGVYTVEKGTEREAVSYTASTISFDAAMQEVRDNAGGIGDIDTGEFIEISGSASNDGIYTVTRTTQKGTASYNSSTIAFNAATSIINDWSYGLGVFGPNDLILVSGSTSNDGYYHVKSGSSDGSALTVDETTLVNEGAAASITISRLQWLSVAEALVTEAAGANVTLGQGHSVVVEEALTEELPGASVTWTALGTKAAQSFQVDSAEAWTVAAAAVKVRRVGSPSDNLVIAVYSDSAGAPGTLLDSATVAGSAISADTSWVAVDLANTQSLAVGTTYWLVVSRDGANTYSDYYEVLVDIDLGYAPEMLKLYDGVGWVSRPEDATMPFRLTGLENTNTQMEKLLTNAAEFIVRSEVDATGTETNQWRSGENTALVELESLLNLGTSNDRRMLARVTRERTVIIQEEPAKPSAIVYFQNADGGLVDRNGLAIIGYPPVGQWIDLKGVIPDAVQLSELLRPAPYLLERAEYRVASKEWRLDGRDTESAWDIAAMRDG